MNTFPINEKKEIKRKFKKCYSLTELEDFNSKKFLRKDNIDNILLIRKFDTNYKVDCFRRSEIKQYIKYNKQYCRPLGSDIQKKNYIHLNISGVECYFDESDLDFIINTNYQIYYAESTNMKLECANTNEDLYTIKVCGGKDCLPKIFGPKPNFDQEEIIEVQEEQEMDPDDILVNNLRIAVDNDDPNLFNQTLRNIETVYGPAGIEVFLNNIIVGEEMEPILIYAIKEHSWNTVGRMIAEGVSLEVTDDIGISPLVSLVFFNHGTDFIEGLQTLFELDDTGRVDDRSLIDLIYYFDKTISLRRSGRFNDIFDLVENYPHDLVDREYKLNILREVYRRNEQLN